MSTLSDQLKKELSRRVAEEDRWRADILRRYGEAVANWRDPQPDDIQAAVDAVGVCGIAVIDVANDEAARREAEELASGFLAAKRAAELQAGIAALDEEHKAEAKAADLRGTHRDQQYQQHERTYLERRRALATELQPHVSREQQISQLMRDRPMAFRVPIEPQGSADSKKGAK